MFCKESSPRAFEISLQREGKNMEREREKKRGGEREGKGAGEMEWKRVRVWVRRGAL